MKLRTRFSALLLAGCMTAAVIPSALADEHDSLRSYDRLVLTKETTCDENGTKHVTDFTYNQHGDLTKAVTVTGDSSTYAEFDLTYDKLGNLTKRLSKSSVPDVYPTDAWETFEYDGRWITSSSSTLLTGKPETTVYETSTDGKTETETTYDESKNVLEKHVYTYDDNGNVIKHVSTDSRTANTTNTVETTYKYDSDNDVIEAVCNKNGAWFSTEKTEYALDSNSILQSATTKTECADGTSSTEVDKYSYDKDGYLSAVTKLVDNVPQSYETYDKDGMLNAIYRSFDASGNPDKSKNYETYEYGDLTDMLKPYVTSVFSDVKADKFYTIPVLWAVNSGITNGMGNSKFEPAAHCTRGQIVTFLWRMAGEPEPESKTSQFTDVKSDSYYTKAVAWAVENGITKGMSATTFEPNRSCTRAQAVTFIWRMNEQPKPEASKDFFKDIDANAYYADAVLWAVDQGITDGMGNGKFEPNTTCTRGHIVTFLYRGFATSAVVD